MIGRRDDAVGRRGSYGQVRSAEAGALEGEAAFLAGAYTRHGAAVYGLARHVAGPGEAGNVTVDAFLSLWRAPHTERPGDASLRISLLAFAHRRAVDVLHSDAENRSRLATMTSADIEQEATDRAGPRVAALLSDLSGDERRALILAYFGGHSCREIATLLGQPENVVKTDIRCGMDRLRSEIALEDPVKPRSAPDR